MPHPNATVAIVIRTKNRVLLLDRALTDVLNQTYHDWVAIVVNDGGEPAPVDRLVAQHSHRAAGRVTVLHNPTSVGMEAASNLGLGATDSSYIAIHDDDDDWHEDFLATTVAHLDGLPAESPERGVMVRTAIVIERVTGDHIEEISCDTFEPSLTDITLLDMLTCNRAVPISFLYRRDVHDTIGLYNEDLPAVGDWDFHLRFLAYHDIGFLNGTPLAFWHQRPESHGDMGNSVIRQEADHRRSDLRVRETYLKEHVQRAGPGALLYLANAQSRAGKHLDQRIDDLERAMTNLGDETRILHDIRDGLRAISQAQEALHHQITQLENGINDASLLSLLRCRYRRTKDRIRTSPPPTQPPDTDTPHG